MFMFMSGSVDVVVLVLLLSSVVSAAGIESGRDL